MTNFRSIKCHLDIAYDHALTAALQGDPYHIYTELLTAQLADAADELGLKLIPAAEYAAAINAVGSAEEHEKEAA